MYSLPGGHGCRRLQLCVGGCQILGALSVVGLVLSGTISAADRTTCLLPLPDTADGREPGGVLPDVAFGASPSSAWSKYMRVWSAHHEDPAETAIRSYLGLGSQGSFDAKPRRGTKAPRWLGWQPRSYQQWDTPHFTVYSRAERGPTQAVVDDLERCYWVWTQLFFPLWEGSAQVGVTLNELDADQSVGEFLQRHRRRITLRRKMRVVFFASADEYQRTLGQDNPGIERSTGFYNDLNQTIFLYASPEDDPETRRHELTHQLFREATLSDLGRARPGEHADFWLVEGIAGYLESLALEGRTATVGGWDSPRLQFARYRVLINQDVMPLAKLQPDGRVEAQQSADLARFYAHSIAHTHRLLDGSLESRRWTYMKLAELYRTRAAQIEEQLSERPLKLSRFPEESLLPFLRLDDAILAENPPRPDLARLCLAGCNVTGNGVGRIKPSAALRWLDLSRLKSIDNQTVMRLAPQPESIQQLSLELTGVDSGLSDWLSRATNLRELDLSWTRADDAVINVLAGSRRLETLWLTGSQVSDRSIPRIASLRELQSVDLQRTKVSAAGLEQLRRSRPQLNINPLELITP